MASAPDYRPHYTTADYEQWEGAWELWKGIAVAMSPSPGIRHQIAAGKIFRALAAAVDKAGCTNCRAVYELDWRVSDDTVVRPDISILCGPLSDELISEPPKLIVEVLSPATEHKDRTAKHQLYESQQVRYYLLADPGAEMLEGWELGPSGYARLAAAFPWTMTLSQDCRVEVDLSETVIGSVARLSL